MHKKLSRLVEPNLQPYFLCFLLFILAALLVEPVLAAAEAVVLLLLYIFYRNQSRTRRRNIMQYVETLNGGIESVGKNSLLNTPLPVVVFQADSGEILWTNAAFMELAEAREGVFDMRIGADRKSVV